ncbi:IclR family transcriptional regulator [Muricoccus aerilatus]|uniref:IclR family transcriptional regulator n=1 Tax=Muricoccus aerilatus TaxID=452982 RepID=UPI0005C1ED46|nr:IclR family transcriptional regulator [Roseomonas aerilata]
MQDDGEAAASDVDPRYIVPGLSRGLALLQLFRRERPAQTLQELASGLGVTRSAAYRLVYTLENDGFILRDPVTRRYRLTARVLTLGFDYLNSQAVAEVAAPSLQRLSSLTSAAAHLVVLDGWHVVYLARVAPAVALVSNLQVGTRLPCHITASGRALLACEDEPKLREIYRLLCRESREVPPPSSFEALRAQAEEDAARGYVYRGSVLDPGLMTFACVVRNGAGDAVAAINVIGPDALMARFGGETALRTVMLETAATISRQIGFSGS